MNDEDFLSKMSPDTHQYLERIKDLYSAPFARELGVEVESISKDEVSLYLDIVPEHINSRGFVHGAVIYGLTDHTLAFMANMEEEAVGQNVNIIYHRPLKEGRLYSKGRVINISKSLKTYEINTYCNGKLISSSVCTAFRLGDRK
ncbi:MAG: PaaI family thioesterase [Candidatus Methanomethylophilaceae archaeon]|nr:PaaI family thioesterase [Candidatus Methanomethylophilaceae archaeon]MBQ6548269.1 PaaI family thioesterase [Candidatus Methanomethylophilaceae archaeon]